MKKTFYELLEVSNTASQETIRTMYQALQKRYAELEGNGSADAAEQFKFIKIAYEVISNPDKRRMYDAHIASSSRSLVDTENKGLASSRRLSSEQPIAASGGYSTAAAPAISPDILKKIKNAWIAGLFSGSVTLVVALLAISGNDIFGASAWLFIDVALIFGLTFGIYKKSRTCAILMLIYFIFSKIIVMVEDGKPSGLPVALVIIYFYWHGIVGTFQYHKALQSDMDDK